MANAFLKLHLVTGDRQWLKLAESSATFIQTHFLPKSSPQGPPGFVTSSIKTAEALPPKAQFDENFMAFRLSNLLFHYTGKALYKEMAENALRFLASPDLAVNFFVGPSLLLAERETGSAPLHIVIVGPKDDPQASVLFRAALRLPTHYKCLEWWDKKEGPLPKSEVTYPDLPKPAAFVCAQQRCSFPAFAPEEIAVRVKQLFPTKN